MAASLAVPLVKPAVDSCNQSVNTRENCTSGERDAHRHASMQYLVPRHVVWTQAPRFAFTRAWATKSIRLRILCGATSSEWASTRPLLMPPREFPHAPSGG